LSTVGLSPDRRLGAAEELPTEAVMTATMYATMLGDVHFHELLLAIDRDLAEACRMEGCEHCGGRLHAARFPRKPRGRPKAVACKLGRDHDLRFSFCCAIEGCRGRETPPSLRFLGRRVYVAAIVVLMAILHNGVSDKRLERLAVVVAVDRRTAERWRRWWCDAFTATPFWGAARARFMPPLAHEQLPAALLARFAGEPADALVALLRFLGPITGGAGRRMR
jgi:hypothetical protein